MYIGQTRRTPEKRFYQHKRYANTFDNKLYAAWRKYGEPKLKTLLICSADMLNFYEELCVKHYNTYRLGYNSTTGGLAPTEVSIATRQKLSIAHKNLNKVVIIGQAQKDAISKALKGNTHGKCRKGCTMSEEQKEKLRIAHTGKKLSAAHIQKISDSHKGINNAFYGKVHSDEMRKIISERTKEGMRKAKLRKDNGT